MNEFLSHKTYENLCSRVKDVLLVTSDRTICLNRQTIRRDYLEVTSRHDEARFSAEIVSNIGQTEHVSSVNAQNLCLISRVLRDKKTAHVKLCIDATRFLCVKLCRKLNDAFSRLYFGIIHNWCISTVDLFNILLR